MKWVAELKWVQEMHKKGVEMEVKGWGDEIKMVDGIVGGGSDNERGYVI